MIVPLRMPTTVAVPETVRVSLTAGPLKVGFAPPATDMPLPSGVLGLSTVTRV